MSVVNGDVVDVQHESTLTAAATPKNFILVVVKVSSDPVLNSPLECSSDEEECDRQRRGLPLDLKRASLKFENKIKLGGNRLERKREYI